MLIQEKSMYSSYGRQWRLRTESVSTRKRLTHARMYAHRHIHTCTCAHIHTGDKQTEGSVMKERGPAETMVF